MEINGEIEIESVNLSPSSSTCGLPRCLLLSGLFPGESPPPHLSSLPPPRFRDGGQYEGMDVWKLLGCLVGSGVKCSEVEM